MKKALRFKFDQNKDLKDELLATNPAYLVEHTKNDKYWGDGGGRGKGINMLGILLMDLRADLIGEQNS